MLYSLFTVCLCGDDRERRSSLYFGGPLLSVRLLDRTEQNGTGARRLPLVLPVAGTVISIAHST